MKSRRLGPEDFTCAEQVQLGLNRLRTALEEIQLTLKELGSTGKYSLVLKEGNLCLMKREEAGSLLPKEVLKRFGIQHFTFAGFSQILTSLYQVTFRVSRYSIFCTSCIGALEMVKARILPERTDARPH